MLKGNTGKEIILMCIGETRVFLFHKNKYIASLELGVST